MDFSQNYKITDKDIANDPDIQYALSDREVAKIAQGRCKLMVYNDLKNVNAIEELLIPYGACLILYEYKPQYGHWCGLIETIPGKRMEFFDSYGLKPDDEKQFIKNGYWKEGYLSKLLYEAAKRGWEIEYNQHPFQNWNEKKISTCGRWVGLRMLLRFLPLSTFKELFYHPDYYISDVLATVITDDIMKNSKNTESVNFVGNSRKVYL